MDLERLLEHTIAIQSIAAPTFHESARAEWLFSAFMETDPVNIEMDVAGNVLVQVCEGEKNPIVVSAHMDSVFPEESVTPATREGDRLRGPGVGDNAVALATLIELCRDLSSDKVDRSIWIVANVAEEGLGNLLGMEHVVQKFGADVDAFIVVEGMALGHIYHQGLPVRRFRLQVTTQGGHAWIHAGRRSAIHELIRIASRLLDLDIQEHNASLNLGRVAGGISVNSIASQASLEIDLRSEQEENLGLLTDRIREIISAAAAPNVEVRLVAIGQRPGGRLATDHRLISLARRAAMEAGLDEPVLASGSTDASLPLSLGLPAICIGVTRGGNAHSVDEFIQTGPIQSGYGALLKLVRYLAQE